MESQAEQGTGMFFLCQCQTLGGDGLLMSAQPGQYRRPQQGGGIVALLLLLALARGRDDPFPWG